LALPKWGPRPKTTLAAREAVAATEPAKSVDDADDIEHIVAVSGTAAAHAAGTTVEAVLPKTSTREPRPNMALPASEAAAVEKTTEVKSAAAVVSELPNTKEPVSAAVVEIPTPVVAALKPVPWGPRPKAAKPAVEPVIATAVEPPVAVTPAAVAPSGDSDEPDASAELATPVVSVTPAAETAALIVPAKSATSGTRPKQLAAKNPAATAEQVIVARPVQGWAAKPAATTDQAPAAKPSAPAPPPDIKVAPKAVVAWGPRSKLATSKPEAATKQAFTAESEAATKQASTADGWNEGSSLSQTSAEPELVAASEPAAETQVAAADAESVDAAAAASDASQDGALQTEPEDAKPGVSISIGESEDMQKLQRIQETSQTAATEDVVAAEEKALHDAVEAALLVGAERPTLLPKIDEKTVEEPMVTHVDAEMGEDTPDVHEEESLGGFFLSPGKKQRGLKKAKSAVVASKSAESLATEKTEIEDEDEQKDQTTCTPPTPSDDDEERLLSSPSKSPREGDDYFPAGSDDCWASLLRWRFVESSGPPSGLATLTALKVQSDHQQSDGGSTPHGGSTASWRQTTDLQKKNREKRQTADGGKAALPRSSENAYKVLSANATVDRETELKRCVQSNLNKICPENVSTIAEKITKEANVQNVAELKSVIGLIFKKALAEPHYCETYADMVYHLKAEMPEFPSESGKPVTFKATLLNVCQDEFESMPRTLADEKTDEAGLDLGEIEFRKNLRKKRFLANMKFIGHLFLRQLLVTKVIAGIMQDLLNCDTAALPDEPIVECVCELVSAIGYTLDENPIGKASLQQVCGRLLDLKKSTREDGKQFYSKRIQFAIQDLLDIRQAGWAKKVFKTAAKTKEEVRLDMQRSAGKDETGAEFVVAGQRPAYLTPGAQSEKPQESQRLLREAVLSRSVTAPAKSR
jgi:hypothetical protein